MWEHDQKTFIFAQGTHLKPWIRCTLRCGCVRCNTKALYKSYLWECLWSYTSEDYMVLWSEAAPDEQQSALMHESTIRCLILYHYLGGDAGNISTRSLYHHLLDNFKVVSAILATCKGLRPELGSDSESTSQDFLIALSTQEDSSYPHLYLRSKSTSI